MCDCVCEFFLTSYTKQPSPNMVQASLMPQINTCEVPFRVKPSFFWTEVEEKENEERKCLSQLENRTIHSQFQQIVNINIIDMRIAFDIV